MGACVGPRAGPCALSSLPMSHRSPARFLAPLALLAASGTIYVVVQAGLKGTATPKSVTGTTVSSVKSGAKKTKGKQVIKTAAKRYTVKPGDVLGAIATRTGVSVDDLLTLNRLDAATPLRVGQKLKLAP